jgi:hypothetical protein
LIENVIGLMIILAVEDEVLLGGLMFFGSLVAYVSVMIARNAR